ncbi:MAG: DNA repair protein RecO [Acidobacteria bacterium]|nr:DNA repair protein RecO [Bryobacteraceae bacterium CoA2 C42]
MPSKVSEAFVLRSYPYREADLIVSFFTRDQGRLRGIARRARRPKSSFGSGLERLSQVNMQYFQRENVELCKMDGCELLQSQFALANNYTASVGLDFIAEVCDQILPAAEPNERFFRLVVATLEHMRQTPPDRTEEATWTAIQYFSLWAVRLSGFLPDLRVSEESRELAREMLTTPIQRLAPREWSRTTCRDLRRFLITTMEQQMERRLVTAQMLETL